MYCCERQEQPAFRNQNPTWLKGIVYSSRQVFHSSTHSVGSLVKIVTSCACLLSTVSRKSEIAASQCNHMWKNAFQNQDNVSFSSAPCGANSEQKKNQNTDLPCHTSQIFQTKFHLSCFPVSFGMWFSLWNKWIVHFVQSHECFFPVEFFLVQLLTHGGRADGRCLRHLVSFLQKASLFVHENMLYKIIHNLTNEKWTGNEFQKNPENYCKLQFPSGHKEIKKNGSENGTSWTNRQLQWCTEFPGSSREDSTDCRNSVALSTSNVVKLHISDMITVRMQCHGSFNSATQKVESAAHFVTNWQNTRTSKRTSRNQNLPLHARTECDLFCRTLTHWGTHFTCCHNNGWYTLPYLVQVIDCVTNKYINVQCTDDLTGNNSNVSVHVDQSALCPVCRISWGLDSNWRTCSKVDASLTFWTSSRTWLDHTASWNSAKFRSKSERSTAYWLQHSIQHWTPSKTATKTLSSPCDSRTSMSLVRWGFQRFRQAFTSHSTSTTAMKFHRQRSSWLDS